MAWKSCTVGGAVKEYSIFFVGMLMEVSLTLVKQNSWALKFWHGKSFRRAVRSYMQLSGNENIAWWKRRQDYLTTKPRSWKLLSEESDGLSRQLFRDDLTLRRKRIAFCSKQERLLHSCCWVETTWIHCSLEVRYFIHFEICCPIGRDRARYRSWRADKVYT